MVDFGSKLKEQQGLKSALEQVILTGQGTPKLLEAITFRHDKDNGELKWKTNFNDGDDIITGCVWTCQVCKELVMSDEINDYHIEIAGPIKQQEDHSMDDHKRQKLLVDCLRDEMNDNDKYSQWERDFAESIGDRVDRGQDLSDKQEAVLEKIWKKYN